MMMSYRKKMQMAEKRFQRIIVEEQGFINPNGNIYCKKCGTLLGIYLNRTNKYIFNKYADHQRRICSHCLEKELITEIDIDDAWLKKVVVLNDRLECKLFFSDKLILEGIYRIIDISPPAFKNVYGYSHGIDVYGYKKKKDYYYFQQSLAKQKADKALEKVIFALRGI